MFALNKLVLSGHPLLGNIFFDFIDNNDIVGQAYKTVIVGNNGVGKSTLLYVIVEIFKGIYRAKESNIEFSYSKNEFSLEYYLDEDLYSLHYLGEKLLLEKNDKRISIKDLKIPKKLIVSTLSTSERFPVGLGRDMIGSMDFDSFYQYFGVKSRRGHFSNGHVVRIAFDTLLSKVGDSKQRGNIHNVFRLLNYDSKIHIEFSQRRVFFKEKKESMDEFRDHLLSFRDTSDKFSSRHIPKYVYDELKSNELIERTIILYGLLSDLSFKVEVDFNKNIDSSHILSKYYKEFILLQKLGVLSTRDITLFRNLKPVSYREISSGESQILSIFLSLAGTLEKGSLVLIDEPDISLHPEWQSKFLELLDSIFSKIQGVHYIIVTHSPFIISDLKEDSANILRLEKKADEIVVSKITGSFYSQSIEDIVLDVFDLATSRNYLLTQRISEVINLIKAKGGGLNPHEKKRFLDLKEKVKTLGTDDPLRVLMERISEKLNV